MFISSVILYFEEEPVGYDLMKSADGFVLQPAPAMESDVLRPTIKSYFDGSGWQTTGAATNDMEQQVQRLIDLHHVIDLGGKLSDAS